MGECAPCAHDAGPSAEIHSHAPGITRIHDLLRQLQKRLPHEPPAGVEDGRGALDRVSKLPLDLLNHALYALRVGDVGRDADCFSAGRVDGVDDGDVGVWVAGEEDDGVGGGEFAGDGGAGLGGRVGVSGCGGKGRGEGGGSGGRTPGPTPAMMAMCLLDIVPRWEAREERRVVGCMNR